MITIVNYEMGNLGSIYNMFRYMDVKVEITDDIEKIKKAKKILLPGVGSFDMGMKKIKEKNFFDILNEKALIEKIPILGICLGMQLLTEASEEGSSKGFGWIAAETLSFKNRINRDLKVPHMGWNVVINNNDSELTRGFENFEEVRFYFVHSYFVKVKDEKYSILKTKYGVKFDSAIQNNNIFGVQFHPEKSHKFGMKIFENFARI